MNENINIGNISTIVKTILLMFAGWAIGYFASKGFNLPIDASQLAELLFTLICIGWAYIDAKNPNTFAFLKNAQITAPVETEEDLINGEYKEDAYE